MPWAVCQTGALSPLWQVEGGPEGVVFTPELFADSSLPVMVCTDAWRCTESGCHLTCTWHDCGGSSSKWLCFAECVTQQLPAEWLNVEQQDVRGDTCAAA